MNILVLNASPKGKNSTTVHTALYLQALHPEHTFTVLPVGQRIRSYEKDFAPLRAELEQADLLLFSYPVYTFIAPYQLHRLIELIKADGVDLSGKFASQITTSKHFYDVTAHRWVEENCFDLGMNVVRGLSADMDDLLTGRGQREARDFFGQLMFSCEHGLFVTPPARAPEAERTVYQPRLPAAAKTKGKDVVIVTNCAPEDENLRNMIADFRAALPFDSRVVNLREFPFAGGCLGCFGCAVTGQCVYKDGFDEFLRTQIQSADAFVYAFTIADHYTQSSFKCYDDRQFCNGHRTVTHGTPIAYLISGDYRYESNLRMIVEARAEAYLPLLDRIRQTGVTCILVHMPFHMAIFDPGAAEDIFPQFPEIEHWYMAGHLMGGAMASQFASGHPDEIDGLILMGAYIYGDYPDENTLTVYGSLNQSVEDHIDYTENIVEIEGGNHAQFGNYGPQKGDAPAAISAQEQQEQTAEAVEAFLNRWIRTEKAPLRGFFSACRKPPRRPEQRESRGKRGRFGRILRDRMCFLHRSVGCGAFLLRNVRESSERN